MKKITIPPEAFVANHLFEDAEFFLQEAKKRQGNDQQTTRRYIRASIITAFAALEAFLNTMLFLYEEIDDLGLVERAFVLEKRVELTEAGSAELSRAQRDYSAAFCFPVQFPGAFLPPSRTHPLIGRRL